MDSMSPEAIRLVGMILSPYCAALPGNDGNRKTLIISIDVQVYQIMRSTEWNGAIPSLVRAFGALEVKLVRDFGRCIFEECDQRRTDFSLDSV